MNRTHIRTHARMVIVNLLDSFGIIQSQLINVVCIKLLTVNWSKIAVITVFSLYCRNWFEIIIQCSGSHAVNHGSAGVQSFSYTHCMRTHYTSIHSTHTWTKVQIAWYLFFCRQKKIDFYWTFKVSTIHNAFFLNRSSFIQKPIQKIRLISAGSTIQFQFHFCVCLYLFLWWCSFSHSLSLSLERRKKEKKNLTHFFSLLFFFLLISDFGWFFFPGYFLNQNCKF